MSIFFDIFSCLNLWIYPIHSHSNGLLQKEYFPLQPISYEKSGAQISNNSAVRVRIQIINWKKNTHQKVSQTLANGGMKYEWMCSDTMDMEFSLTVRGYAKLPIDIKQ